MESPVDAKRMCHTKSATPEAMPLQHLSMCLHGFWRGQSFLEGCRCCFLESGQDVAIRVERDPNVGVARPLAHDLRMGALPEHKARVRVPEIVEPNLGIASAPCELPPRLAHGAWQHARPVPALPREHQVVCSELCVSEVIADCLGPLSVRPERQDGALRECHGPAAAGCLRGFEHRLPVSQLDKHLCNGQGGPGEVDVFPP